MSLWSIEQAWVVGGENRYRNKDAYYFLPGESEWYKAAYYDGDQALYYDYATGSNTAPTATIGSTLADTAVYTVTMFTEPTQPARVNNAGGLSVYGTMGQSGNAWEWTESMDGTADDPNKNRMVRGGDYLTTDTYNLSSGYRLMNSPTSQTNTLGFRVASVPVIPEPSSVLLLLFGGAACRVAVRRKIPSSPRA
jgi:formylglycine-generating enzyme required for sulfatase activity